MKIIETPIFTKKVISLLTQEEYRSLQNELITNCTYIYKTITPIFLFHPEGKFSLIYYQ